MRKRSRRNHSYGSFWIGFVAIIVIAGLVLNYARPLPDAVASNAVITSEVATADLAWPQNGAAAIGAKGFGTLATHGTKLARPTASIAKLITALAILEKKPLTKGKQGPSITITQADVDLYDMYLREHGAVVKVVVGEKISEYQALQAMLLPSANNMADTAAIWAFGSMNEYHTYANKMAKRLGLTQTVIAGDASGMLPATKSTTSDLITLGEAALNNPIISEIIAQKSAVIPEAGTISSANARLGVNVTGIKTGLTDEAGGCFLFAGNHTLPDGQHITIIGVIVGMEKFRDALTASEPLINSAETHFTVVKPIKAGDNFASITVPWLSGKAVPVVAKKDVSLVAWKGVPLSPRIELQDIAHALPAGAEVGRAIAASGKNEASTPLVLQKAIGGPSLWWRLSRLQ